MTSSIAETDAMVVIDRILGEAIAAGASDIHLDPDAAGGTLRFRVDGFFGSPRRLAPDLYRRCLARLKLIGGVVAYRDDIPQDGRIEASGLAVDTDLRLAVMPTPYGEKAVVRVFHGARGALALGDLGFDPAVVTALAGLCQRRQGLVLATGPCSSGKTTTLYAMLRQIIELRGAHDHVVSIEDPVECRLPGVAQLEVGAERGVSFAAGLKALMRQDPQVILVGEIRDAETAAIACEAAFTGHLVLSSMHVGEPAEVAVRLLHMGVASFVVASALAAIVSQRLVRRLCDACAEADPRTPLESLRQHLGAAIGRRGRGCASCGGRGFRGRLAFATVSHASDDLAALVLERAARGRIAAAMSGDSMLAAAAKLVAAGLTDVAEVERALGVATTEERP